MKGMRTYGDVTDYLLKLRARDPETVRDDERVLITVADAVDLLTDILYPTDSREALNVDEFTNKQLNDYLDARFRGAFVEGD